MKVRIEEIDPSNLGGVYACGSFIFVVINPKQKHWDLVDTIVHESVHVFQKALAYVQETVSGTETQAYYIAGITVNLLKDFHALHDQREAGL